MDAETTGRFRGMIELITSAFFGDNDYSVFADLVVVAVDLVCMVLAPLIIFNLHLCSRYEEGECTSYNTVSWSFSAVSPSPSP